MYMQIHTHHVYSMNTLMLYTHAHSIQSVLYTHMYIHTNAHTLRNSLLSRVKENLLLTFRNSLILVMVLLQLDGVIIKLTSILQG